MGSDLSSHLTHQELRIARSATLDVGAGYPHLTLPDWLRAEVWDTSQFGEIYAFPPDWSPETARRVTLELLESACRLLGISTHHAAHGFVTFSGSASLDRVIESQVGHGRSVITTSPCIDIIPGMFSERHEANVIYVPANDRFGLDLAGLADRLDSRTDCIVLTSPENPTGNVISAADLAAVSELAAERGISLVLDQCFGLIDPFKNGIPLLPNLAPEDLDWIFLWDTGKTFGLNEDKLGFIFCSPSLYPRISQRLNILQFDVSRRLKYLFLRIFDAALTNDYPLKLSEAVRSNIALAERACANSTLRALRPNAGSFLLLDTSESAEGADALATRLLREARVGVIRTDSFFHPTPSPEQRDRYLRIALAREPGVLAEALDRILEVAARPRG